MAGEYCTACGQRRFRPQDRRFAHLLREAFDAVTELDGRLWRSLRALMLQPGRIARDWFDGRRAGWVSPIRLFLLANLIYFLAPMLSDLTLPLHNQVRGDVYRALMGERCKQPAYAWKCDGGQPHSALTTPVFLRKLDRARADAAVRGEAFDPVLFEERYNARSDAISKLVVIMHVPFVAGLLALVAWRRHRYFAEHFVVALGLVAFILLFMQLVNAVFWLSATADRAWPSVPLREIASGLQYLAFAGFLAHFTLACRRCYDSRWPMAAMQGLLALSVLALSSLFVYRPLQFVLALWTM